MAATQVRAMQGDTVDLICWRHYGRTDGVTEGVYRANHGLAELGVILPHGLLITLPDAAQTQPADTTLHLWD